MRRTPRTHPPNTLVELSSFSFNFHTAEDLQKLSKQNDARVSFYALGLKGQRDNFFCFIMSTVTAPVSSGPAYPSHLPSSTTCFSDSSSSTDKHSHEDSLDSKRFQSHVLFRWIKPGQDVRVVGSWNGYVT